MIPTRNVLEFHGNRTNPKWLSWSSNIIFPKNQYKEKVKSAVIAAALVILVVALTYIDYGNPTARGNCGAYASSFGMLMVVTSMVISLRHYGRGIFSPLYW